MKKNIVRNKVKLWTNDDEFIDINHSNEDFTDKYFIVEHY